MDQPEAAKIIACVDDQRSVISDRLIVDRVVVGCHDDSIGSFGDPLRLPVFRQRCRNADYDGIADG
ncbi:hypothetical protein X734_05785 [Mesorhizobium sp. L2C084A000]|nr:hypothetical protein X734_05785 [Mesorhizobium sp. L2C084A000]